jgi:hypothetical protein
MPWSVMTRLGCSSSWPLLKPPTRAFHHASTISTMATSYALCLWCFGTKCDFQISGICGYQSVCRAWHIYDGRCPPTLAYLFFGALDKVGRRLWNLVFSNAPKKKRLSLPVDLSVRRGDKKRRGRGTVIFEFTKWMLTYRKYE